LSASEHYHIDLSYGMDLDKVYFLKVGGCQCEHSSPCVDRL